MFPTVPDNLKFIHPWEEILQEKSEGIILELKAEVSKSHPLFHVKSKPVASRCDTDDVLFITDDPELPLVVVHLTWSANKESYPYPWTVIYSSWDQWVKTEMEVK